MLCVPVQILDQLRRVNFTTKNGFQVSFDSKGDPVALYELINWQIRENGTMDFVTVGSYDSSKPRGQEISISRPISWVGGQTKVHYINVYTFSSKATYNKLINVVIPLQ